MVDATYTNGRGFLAPFYGQHYHLNDWRDGYQPSTLEEFFNMKHSRGRSAIGKCFGMLKMPWAILRSLSFYHVKTQCQAISMCCMIDNSIMRERPMDPMENELNITLIDKSLANVKLINRATTGVG